MSVGGPERSLFGRVKSAARLLRREVQVWRCVLGHPRTPWVAKALLGFAVAYLLVPFDLIPDFIPVLGWLDDVILAGVPIALAARLVPPDVLAECRARAARGGPA